MTWVFRTDPLLLAYNDPVSQGRDELKSTVTKGRGGIGGPLACCMAAFVLHAVIGSVLNASVYSFVSTYCGIARELSTLANSLAFLAVFLAATLRPRLIDRRQLTTIGIACAVVAGTLLEFGLSYQIRWATIIGLSCLNIAFAWTSLLLICALCALRSARSSLLAIAVGMALGALITPFVPVIAAQGATAAIIGCVLASFALLYRGSGSLLDRVRRSEAPSSLEISNPESFPPLDSGLFLCTFLFSIATGFGIAFGEVDRAPADIGASALVILGAAVWLLASRSADKEDSLFSFCILTVVAGFLVAPLAFPIEATSANALLRIGVCSFQMLTWLVVVAIAARNPLAAIPTLALICALGSLGTVVGAVAGHTTNGLIDASNDTKAILVINSVLFLFVALLWTSFRTFSFSRAIRGIVGIEDSRNSLVVQDRKTEEDSVKGERAGHGRAEGSAMNAEAVGAENKSASEDGEDRQPSIEERCRAIGGERGLTAREIEIFAFLARGRNGRFLMEHYVVSRNTVKSHIKHIYAKLGVHSQQELIDMVEHAG